MKKILSVTLLLLSAVSYMLLYTAFVRGELSDNILRLHILANSDSEKDQNIKLSVRDYISEGLRECTVSPKSDEYISYVEALAKDCLREMGTGYSAKAERERVYIPKKSYKNITMPSGEYNAIRVWLGEGKGQNWWCVAYPSLCFSESFDGSLSEEAMNKLKKTLSPETLSLITEKKEYRLYIVDLVGRIMEKMEKTNR